LSETDPELSGALEQLVDPVTRGDPESPLRWTAKSVLVHDFMDKELGKAIPYGVYDVSENQGWVSVIAARS
jgi:hypothetical protein